MDYQKLINEKIFLNLQDLEQKLAFRSFKGKRVAFTNGCFDILHLGHAKYLSTAASLGDVLIIGLNSDNSVRRLKGDNRPINPMEARAFLLAVMGFVDAVVVFDEDTPYDLIKFVQPDVLVKGEDYKVEDIVGYDIVKAKGGEVVTISFEEGYSTTNIIHKQGK